MRNGTECKGLSRWLVAFGILAVLAPEAASAGNRARSAPRARSSHAASAPEAAPLLLTDPASGASIRIWSRSDGFTTKIAWARNDGTGWGPSHDLTFGLGVDRDPSVAITSAGAWLFWRDDRDGIFYAPLELGAGRLLGVPSSLPLPRTPGRDPHLEGGGDVPTVLGSCEPTELGCILARQRLPGNPGQPNPTSPPVMGDGGSDIPVTITTNTSGATLISVAQADCQHSIVTVVQNTTSLVVSELDGAGRMLSQHFVRIGSGISPVDAGIAASEYYLNQACGTGN